MSRVLITGASGFIGQHLVEALVARGTDVACLVRPTSPVDRLRSLGARLVSGDVTDEAGLHEPIASADLVYHLAGLTSSLRPGDFERVNAGGVRAVAAACAARTTPPVLVIVSSIAAAGPSRGRALTEQDPPAPISHYGKSKLAGERAAAERAGDLPITIVRPPIVFGEGDRLMLSMLRPIARYGMHVVSGFGDRWMSLIHARDVAEALILAAERGKRLPKGDGRPGEGIYFVGCEEDPTYAEIGRRFGAAMGRSRTRILRLGPLGIWGAALSCEAIARLRRRSMIFSLDKAREARAGSWACDSGRARRDLGFAPAAPLNDRIRQTVEWYQAQGWL